MRRAKLLKPIMAIASAAVITAPISSCSKSDVAVESVELKQEYSWVETGSTRNFGNEVVVLPANATNRKLKWSISEQSSNTTVATVDEDTGVVTGINPGYVKLIAQSTDGSEKASEGWIIVGSFKALEKFELLENEKTVYMNTTGYISRSFSPIDATVQYCKWESSDDTIVQVNEEGNLTPIAPGTAVITITPYDFDIYTKEIVLRYDLAKTCNITVEYATARSIEITPAVTFLNVDDEVEISTKVLPIEAKQDAIYDSTSPEGQEIFEYDSETKKVKAKNIGTAYLNLKSESFPGVTATAKINVVKKLTPVESIEFTDTYYDAIVGEVHSSLNDVEVLPVKATIQSFSLESSDPSIVAINPKSKTEWTAKKPGTCTLTAISDDGVHKSQNTYTVVVKEDEYISRLYLTSSAASIQVGQNFKISSYVLPETACQNVTWTTEDPTVATVNSQGLVTGVSNGQTRVIAETEGKMLGGATIKQHCTITVTDDIHPVLSIKLDASEITTNTKDTTTVNATVLPEQASISDVAWRSEDTNIVTIKPSETSKQATITPVSAGTTYIYAISLDGNFVYSDRCKVTVKYDPIESITLDPAHTVLLGEKGQLTAKITPETACQDVTWSSNDPDVVQVNSETGEINGLKLGDATIVARTKGLDSGGQPLTSQCTVSVVSDIIKVKQIKLTPDHITVMCNKNFDYPTVNYIPENCSHKEVSWEIDKYSQDHIKMVGDHLAAIKEGTATLSCTSVDGPGTYCEVNVLPAPPTDLNIIYCPEFMHFDETEQIKWQFLPATAPQDAEFTSSDPDIVNVDLYSGKLTAKKLGNVNITIKSKWDPLVSKTLPISVVPVRHFVDEKWDIISKYAQAGIETIHNCFRLDCEQNKDFPGTLIGYQKTIKLGGIEHKVRVIGEDQDICGKGKAALTFELTTVWSKSRVAGYETKWDKEWAFNFPESILYANLNGGANQTFEKSALETIKEEEPELFNVIRTATKTVNKWNGSKFEPGTYEAKLFPLSINEVNYPSKAPGKEQPEGSPYGYYVKHSSEADHAKPYIEEAGEHGDVATYWLVSPYTINKNDIYRIGRYGELINGWCANTDSIVFAFCI